MDRRILLTCKLQWNRVCRLLHVMATPLSMLSIKTPPSLLTLPSELTLASPTLRLTLRLLPARQPQALFICRIHALPLNLFRIHPTPCLSLTMLTLNRLASRTCRPRGAAGNLLIRPISSSIPSRCMFSLPTLELSSPLVRPTWKPEADRTVLVTLLHSPLNGTRVLITLPRLDCNASSTAESTDCLFIDVRCLENTPHWSTLCSMPRNSLNLQPINGHDVTKLLPSHVPPPSNPEAL